MSECVSEKGGRQNLHVYIGVNDKQNFKCDATEPTLTNAFVRDKQILSLFPGKGDKNVLNLNLDVLTNVYNDKM